MMIADALSICGPPTAECELLLSACLQRDRTWVIAHPEYVLSPQQHSAFMRMLERRSRGEPLAYIRGTKEFYGRKFRVTPHVLIPRPATEQLVEQALHVLRGDVVPTIQHIDAGIVAWSTVAGDCRDVGLVADIGTGSGCIAITLACELPNIRVIATDVSAEALHIARINAAHHGVQDRITFMQGHALEPLKDIREPFIVVSNPPYIPHATDLPPDVVLYEPHTALFAGNRGTDVLDAITTAAHGNAYVRGLIIECREEQALV